MLPFESNDAMLLMMLCAKFLFPTTRSGANKSKDITPMVFRSRNMSSYAVKKSHFLVILFFVLRTRDHKCACYVFGGFSLDRKLIPI